MVDIPASQDATLYESPDGSLANGGGNSFFAGRTSQGINSIRRGLLQFDIASFIPAGATIDLVDLTLFLDRGGNGDTAVSLYRLTKGWTEGITQASGGEGGGAPVLGNDATWLHSTYDTVFWSGPGAEGDYDLQPSSSQFIAEINSFYVWHGLENDVAAWLADSSTNHGWLLKGDEESSSTSCRFVSRTNPEEDLRPVLHVEFTPIPEPAAGALAGLALLPVLRRRR
jgi:hypothetical protein